MQATAQAIIDSAEASKTLARIAEEVDASSKASGWKSTVSIIISLIALAVALGEYIRNFKG